MKIERHFTTAATKVWDCVTWTRRIAQIKDADNKVLFELEVEVPEQWSETATNIAAAKFFRKSGVPQTWEDAKHFKIPDGHVFSMWEGALHAGRPGERGCPLVGPERSLRQVIKRLVLTWRVWGETEGYFDKDNGQAFEDEMTFILLRQIASPNSPQWFNTGLHQVYGITGPAQGHWWGEEKHIPVGNSLKGDVASVCVHESTSAYERPQPHACFIQSVTDELLGEDGVMGLWEREARVFKFGSGTGTNFSSLRGAGEPLVNGGRAGGLMGWLKIGDAVGGAIKSGGSTRKAAKMVCLDADHPDIESFINWKAKEELKASYLIGGFRMDADIERFGILPGGASPETLTLADQFGLHLDEDFNGETYQSIGGQNSNNSVRVSQEFMQMATGRIPDAWKLRWRTDGRKFPSSAVKLWKQIAAAAHLCADPGVQFHDTINDWHTCPGDGLISASNPCSEYMFLDDTGCNLASINLMKFFIDTPEGATFDTRAFRAVVRLLTLVLDISVTMAQYPSRRIAEKSVSYRTLGLGYANLGSLLMACGCGYGSERGRAIAAGVTALMTGLAYEMSAELAGEMGAFCRYKANAGSMTRVIRNHARSAGALLDPFDDAVVVRPHLLRLSIFGSAVTDVWTSVILKGKEYGFRNAQVTVLAPTGTIGLVMDCDTTGVEPEFALVRTKKMAGGGVMQLVNSEMDNVLRRLGYSPANRDDMIAGCLAGKDWWLGMPESHQQIFKTAAGKLSLCWQDHVDMMAAVQPFISGAISKTINMPSTSTVGDVEDAYNYAWANGVKALAIYRDGCKRSQPLTAKKESRATTAEPDAKNKDDLTLAVPGSVAFPAVANSKTAKPVEAPAVDRTMGVEGLLSRLEEEGRSGLDGSPGNPDAALAARLIRQLVKAPPRSLTKAELDELKELTSLLGGRAIQQDGSIPAFRQKLPATRQAVVHKFHIGNHTCYLVVGLYENGQPGELFLRMSKAGSTVHGLLENFGRAVSMAWQYGMPLDMTVDAFSHQRFEPNGMTDDRDIPLAASVLDYTFRWLGRRFLPGRAAPDPARGVPEGAVSPGSRALPPGASPDGPPCPICGHIMIRSGACHKCLNCGEQGGCG